MIRSLKSILHSSSQDARTQMHVLYASASVKSLWSKSNFMSVQGKVAKWWIPDDVVFVKEIPHTATGKMYKLKLRQLFKDFRFGNSRL